MPGFEYNHLFDESGPRSMLDYLRSHLAAGNLSAEEALAMVGAIHEELTDPTKTDRGLYQDYSEFMESLRTQMPQVHDYIVSAWNQRGGNKGGVNEGEERSDTDAEDGEALKTGDSRPVTRSAQAQFKGSDLSEERGGEEEEDEPDEVEEKETDEKEAEDAEADKSDEVKEPEEESDKEEEPEAQNEEVDKEGEEEEDDDGENESDEEDESIEEEKDEEDTEGEEGQGGEESQEQGDEKPEEQGEGDGEEIAEEPEEKESSEAAEGNKVEGDVIEKAGPSGMEDVETEPFEEEDGSGAGED